PEVFYFRPVAVRCRLTQRVYSFCPSAWFDKMQYRLRLYVVLAFFVVHISVSCDSHCGFLSISKYVTPLPCNLSHSLYSSFFCSGVLITGMLFNKSTGRLFKNVVKFFIYVFVAVQFFT